MKKMSIQISIRIFIFIFIICLLSFSIFGIFGTNFAATAQGVKSLFAQESVPGVSEAYNYIMVIDESGSMKINDPQNLRKDAAKLFVYLAETLNKGNSVLISGFGKTTNVYLPLTEISGNEKEISSAIDSIQSNQALTDMKDALEKIKQELDYSTDRKKTVVIFLTDGSLTLDDIPPESLTGEKPSRERPGKPSSGEDPAAITDNISEDKNEKAKTGDLAENEDNDAAGDDTDTPKRESDYLEIYKKELIDLCRAYKNSGVVIHPIAFTKEAEVTILEQMADITGGICYKPQEAKDLRVSFIDILSNISSRFIKIQEQQGPSALTGEFTMGPYIREIVAIGLKNDYTQNPAIKIFNPLSSQVAFDEYIEENIFKIGKIVKPDDGKWNYEISGDAVFVFDIVDSSIIEPRFGVYAAGATVPLKIDISGILKSDGAKLDDFKITATIENPDGIISEAGDINDKGDGNDLVASDGVFTGSFSGASAQGYYDINYSITHMPTGAVSNRVLSFSAKKFPLQIKVVEPSQKYYPVNTGIDVVIEVEKNTSGEQSGGEINYIYTADISFSQGVIVKDLLLLDNGQGADIKAGDGLFSGRFTGTSTEGTYSVDYFISEPDIFGQPACSGLVADFKVGKHSAAELEIENNYFTGEPAMLRIDLKKMVMSESIDVYRNADLKYVLTKPDGTTAEGTLFDDGSIANADMAPQDGVYSAAIKGLDLMGKYDIKVEGIFTPEDILEDGLDAAKTPTLPIDAEGVFYKYFEVKGLPEVIGFKDGNLTTQLEFNIISASASDAGLSIGQPYIKSDGESADSGSNPGATESVTNSKDTGNQSNSKDTDSSYIPADSKSSGNDSSPTTTGSITDINSAFKSAILKSGEIIKADFSNAVVIELELDKNVKAGSYIVEIPVSIDDTSTKNIIFNVVVSQAGPPYMLVAVIGSGVILLAVIIILAYFLYIRPKRRGY